MQKRESHFIRPPCLSLEVTSPDRYQRGIFLFNTWQQYGDGRTRTRNGLLSEKLTTDEMPLEQNLHEAWGMKPHLSLSSFFSFSVGIPPFGWYQRKAKNEHRSHFGGSPKENTSFLGGVARYGDGDGVTSGSRLRQSPVAWHRQAFKRKKHRLLRWFWLSRKSLHQLLLAQLCCLCPTNALPRVGKFCFRCI